MSDLENAKEFFAKGLLELGQGNPELSKSFFEKVLAIKNDHIPSFVNIINILM